MQTIWVQTLYSILYGSMPYTYVFKSNKSLIFNSLTRESRHMSYLDAGPSVCKRFLNTYILMYTWIQNSLTRKPESDLQHLQRHQSRSPISARTHTHTHTQCAPALHCWLAELPGDVSCVGAAVAPAPLCSFFLPDKWCRRTGCVPGNWFHHSGVCCFS